MSKWYIAARDLKFTQNYRLQIQRQNKILTKHLRGLLKTCKLLSKICGKELTIRAMVHLCLVSFFRLHKTILVMSRMPPCFFITIKCITIDLNFVDHHYCSITIQVLVLRPMNRFIKFISVLFSYSLRSV